jgi:multicomponent Na+:H+ antiporter subunit E
MRRMATTGRHRNILVQAAFLMAAWLILSGHYDFLHILYGVLSVAGVILLNLRLRHIPLVENEPEGMASAKLGRLLLYLPWLLWQIVVSGIYVAGVVLSPHLRQRLQPEILRFRSRQPGVMARVILGNSITLTPGTLTLDISGDEFVVHALTTGTANGLAGGSMQRWVAGLYTRDIPAAELCADVRHIASRAALRQAGLGHE